MLQWYWVLLIVLGVIALVLGVLYVVGKRMQRRVDQQQSMINQTKMTTSILVIDKKKMRIQDSSLPKVVQDQVPFYLKFRKVPLVKAKIGPKIMTLMCDEKVYKDIPVKKQVKIELSGMYIVSLKGGKSVSTAKGTASANTGRFKLPKFKIPSFSKKSQ